MKYLTLFRTFSVFIALFAVTVCHVKAQTPSLIWQHCYGGDSTDGINCVQQTSDGGFIAAGFTRSTNGDLATNGGVKGLWVLKLDGVGNIQWEKTYSDTLNTAFYIEPTYDGGYILTGTQTMKLHSDGSIQWIDNIEGATIHQVTDSGYIMCNSFGITPAIIKLDAGGGVTWQHNYGTATTIVNLADVRPSAAGGYVISGESADIHPTPFYGRTDNSGNLTMPIVSIIEHGSGGALCKTSDGDYLFVDNLLSGSFNITKFDDMLATQWHAGPMGAWAAGIAATTDNGTVVWTGSSITTSADMTLIKIDSTSPAAWTYSFTGTSTDAPHNVIQAFDDNYVVAATISTRDATTPGNHGGGDGWVAKVGFPESVPQPHAGADIKVYPIPAGSMLHVSLPEGLEGATLRLQDISGSLLATDNGNAQLRKLDLSHLPAGNYLLEVSDKGNISSYKIAHY